MIIKGDKIELVKETRAFKKIGTKFEVDRIDEGWEYYIQLS